MKNFSTLGAATVDSYSSCIALATNGLSINMTSAIGAVPLELRIMLQANPNDPLDDRRASLYQPTFVPATGNSPSCTVRDGKGAALIWAADGIPLEQNKPYTMTCRPDPKLANNGQTTNLTMATYMDALMWGAPERNPFSTLLFHGPPPQPRSPPPQPRSPPSPKAYPPPPPPARNPSACLPFLPAACQQPWTDQSAQVRQSWCPHACVGSCGRCMGTAVPAGLPMEQLKGQIRCTASGEEANYDHVYEGMLYAVWLSPATTPALIAPKILHDLTSHLP